MSMTNNMTDDISEIFFSEEQIEEITVRIGKQISEDYKDKNLMLVCVLKGSIMFMSDLMKHISIPCKIDFLAAESYGSAMKSSGEVKITKDLSSDIRGLDLLLVEDILDSGMTLSHVRGMLQQRNPASIKVCTLLDKPERRKAAIASRVQSSVTAVGIRRAVISPHAALTAAASSAAPISHRMACVPKKLPRLSPSDSSSVSAYG